MYCERFVWMILRHTAHCKLCKAATPTMATYWTLNEKNQKALCYKLTRFRSTTIGIIRAKSDGQLSMDRSQSSKSSDFAETTTKV
jgi:hypothetical protein